MFELLDTVGQQAVIKVIGVGGGGGNAVDHMVQTNIEGVEFINANTDAQALARSNAKTILQLGSNLTKGLGAGADPDVGRQAAMEDRDRISEAIEGADMVFITAGMGGGTGTGAAPIIAQIAREQNILAVAVVTRPFPFEGGMRMQLAEAGIAELGQHVDSLITIPNEKVLAVMGRGAPLLDAFAKANDVLLNAVQGISELITRPGLINVDFADVRAVMAEMGMAVMGSATAVGEDRAMEASRAAVSSPLLEDINLSGARGILVNVTAGIDFAIGEFEEVGKVLQEFASDQAKVVIGAVLDPDMRGELRVTMVATGIGTEAAEEFPQRDRMRVVQANSRPQQQQQQNVANSTGAGDSHGNDRAAGAPNWRTDGSGANVSPGDAGSVKGASKDSNDMGYLDIPAFLRKQAD